MERARALLPSPFVVFKWGGGGGGAVEEVINPVEKIKKARADD
jgi:hypothetical protein